MPLIRQSPRTAIEPTGTDTWPGASILAVAVRATLLVLVAILTLLFTHDPTQLRWIALLALAALPLLIAPGDSPVTPLARLATVIVLAIAASGVAAAADLVGLTPAGYGATAVLPYLVVPAATAALAGSMGQAAGLLGVHTAAYVAVGALTSTGDGARQIVQPGYLMAGAQWLLLAAIGAVVAGVVRRTVLARGSVQPYAEATRLLTQLRSVARQLPGTTLDPSGLAQHLLDEACSAVSADRAAVLCGSGSGRLIVLAQAGGQRVDWETSLDSDSAIADAWASQQPQVSSRSQARSHPGGDVSALVVPLVAGVRTVGLIVLERDDAHAYQSAQVRRVSALAAPAALRLEAALLFDDVRSLATNEERQRLAREIHDGVAQELVMVGYGIDNALATLPDQANETAAELRTLRAEVTRVITELRLSLFELRSEVDRHGGLTAAIADYARTVGASAGLRVHMSLDESTARLPAAIEAELLRIAQEAITNARKHAGATNLWVTCEVDPPYAQISVTDDGHGIGDQRAEGRYGLAIMAERAERIRGRLEIKPRNPSGTTVAVVLGTPPQRASL